MTMGLYPWTPLGALLPEPHYRFALSVWPPNSDPGSCHVYDIALLILFQLVRTILQTTFCFIRRFLARCVLHKNGFLRFYSCAERFYIYTA